MRRKQTVRWSHQRRDDEPSPPYSRPINVGRSPAGGWIVEQCAQNVHCAPGGFLAADEHFREGILGVIPCMPAIAELEQVAWPGSMSRSMPRRGTLRHELAQ